MKHILIFFLFILILTTCFGQRANNWAFEPNSGLTFEYDSLKRFNTNLYNSFGGSTGSSKVYRGGVTMSDKKGKLLFYTNGIYLVNKNHQIVNPKIYLNQNRNNDLNKDFLSGGSAQNKNIICTINDSLFYLFSLFQNTNILDITRNYNSEIRFCAISIVNDSPVVIIKDSVVYRGASMNLNSVKVKDGEYWLVLHECNSFKSFYVKEGNISLKNVSTSTEINDCGFYNYSVVSFNLSNEIFFTANHSARYGVICDTSEFAIFRFNFDKVSGQVSNQTLINKTIYHNIEKRPQRVTCTNNGQLLYLSYYVAKRGAANYPATVNTDQIQIKGDSIFAINPVIISGNYSDLCNDHQWAYDGKLYLGFRKDIAIITQPDSFPCTPYLKYRYDYLKSNVSVLPIPFSGVDFEYHKIGFKYKMLNCSNAELTNLSDTSFFKSFTWYVDNKDSISGYSIPSSFIPYGKHYIVLKGENKDGFKVWFVDSINKIAPPQAKIHFQSTVGCQFVAFDFTDQSTADTSLDNTIVCNWDFGDGEKLTYKKYYQNSVRQIVHTYLSSGSYTITLIVSNGICTDTIVLVNKIQILPAPEPGFTVQANNWCQLPVTMLLNAKSNTNVSRYYYDMGNGDTISTTNSSISYIYNSIGVFKIHQRVLGLTGCITEDSATVSILGGVSAGDTITILRTTFIQDSTATKTVWKSVPNATHYSINNKIVRDTFYIENDNIPNTQSKIYIVYAFDSCGDKSTFSSVETIFLKAENMNFNEYAVLEFTPYKTWVNGVLDYQVEYFNEESNLWNNISSLPANIFKFTPKIFPDTFILQNLPSQICYRIVAREKNGNEQLSISNMVCVRLYPIVFLPNAFSPNGDGINDYFKPICGGLNNYIFEIYDRWGQLVYSDTPESRGWDGFFRGKPAEPGIYSYRLSAASYLKSPATNDARIIERKGSLLLLR